jgi:uncharacterized lipoprotein YmbA
MIDYVLNYLKKNNIPVTRQSYIEYNWLGQYDWRKPLPAELEAELPKELQLKD